MTFLMAPISFGRVLARRLRKRSASRPYSKGACPAYARRETQTGAPSLSRLLVNPDGIEQGHRQVVASCCGQAAGATGDTADYQSALRGSADVNRLYRGL